MGGKHKRPGYPHGLTDATGHPIGPDGKRVGGETVEQNFGRRIAALEAHIADLEERLNDRGIFSGDGKTDARELVDRER